MDSVFGSDPQRFDRAKRLTRDLLATVRRVSDEEALESWEIELAAGHLFTTLICALGTQDGKTAEEIIAHVQGLGPLLVGDVCHKLGREPFAEN